MAAAPDPRPSGEVFVELRVHGVSGTTATDLLDVPAVTTVAGDASVVFARPADEAARAEDGGVLEGMSWGRLTSGLASQALWLLLLPFALANLALFTVPPDVTGRRRAVVDTCLRLLALSGTALMSLTAFALSADLVAWQCAGDRGCAWVGDRLAFAAGWPWTTRVALAALVPVLLIAALAWLSYRVSLRYETTEAPEPGDGPPPDNREQRPTLGSPLMWRGEHLVARLRGVHISTAWCAVTAALVALLAVREIEPDPSASVLAWAGGGLAAAVVLAGVVLVVGPGPLAPWTWWTEHPLRLGPFHQASVSRALLAAGLVSTVLAATAHLLSTPEGATTDTTLPGLVGTFMALVLVQAVLLAVLLACLLPRTVRHLGRTWRANLARAWSWMRRRTRSEPTGDPVLAGTAPFLVASSAVLLGYAVSSGAMVRVAQVLEPEGGEPLAIPPVLQWASLGFFLVVAVIAGFGAAAAFAVTRVPDHDVREVLAVYRGIDDPDAETVRHARGDHRYRRVVRARRAARAIQSSHVFGALAVGSVVGLAIAVYALLLAYAPRRGDAGYVDLTTGQGWEWTAARAASSAGGWLVAASAAGAVAVAVAAWRSETWRRRVGIAWDVLSFWPRAAHPLAPPSYPERAVPQLVARTCWLARHHVGGVLLSGHSQGSVLTVAVVEQLRRRDPDVLARVALLTHGSPLSRLYAPVFPDWFSAARLAEVRDSLTLPGRDGADGDGASAGGDGGGGDGGGGGRDGERPAVRWRNLWRATDPVGENLRAVLGEADVECRDPVGVDMDGETARYPTVDGHSHYPRGSEYAAARQELRRALGPVVGVRHGRHAPPAQGSRHARRARR
jgi:hypothetical protein